MDSMDSFFYSQNCHRRAAEHCPKKTKEDSVKRVQMAYLNFLDDFHRRQNAIRLFLLTNIDKVNLAVRRYGRLHVEIEIEQILMKQLQQTKHTSRLHCCRFIKFNCQSIDAYFKRRMRFNRRLCNYSGEHSIVCCAESNEINCHQISESQMVGHWWPRRTRNAIETNRKPSY